MYYGTNVTIKDSLVIIKLMIIHHKRHRNRLKVLNKNSPFLLRLLKLKRIENLRERKKTALIILRKLK